MQIRELKLTNVIKYAKDKNGNQYKDRNGKPYIRISITAEGLERTASALVYRNTDPIYGWTAGNVVQAIVEYNGDYINIRAAGRLDRLEARLETLEKKLLTPVNPARSENERVEEELNDIGAEPIETSKEEELPF